jgi:multidrug efflux pump subunit AcrA (membrane-fusion protein)
MSLAPPPPTPSNSQPPGPSPALAGLPSLNGSPTPEHPEIGDGPARKFPTYLVLGGGALAIVVTAVLLYYFTGRSKTDRPDLLLHTVKAENLDLTVVERGTLESADNRDIICHVKQGAKGNYASTIKWVIDDGTLVKKGQLIMSLDSSLLEDNYRTEKITLDKAQADWVNAEQDYKIVVSQNESDIEKAKTDIAVNEISLEQYVGLPKGTLSRLKREESRALLLEMEKDLLTFLERHKTQVLADEGEYQKILADWMGQIELADADVEMWKDHLAYSQRMQLKGYLSPSQVQADESRLAGSKETLKKVRAEKQLLQSFSAQAEVKKRSAAVQEAWRTLERTAAQAVAKEVQAEAKRKTMRSVYLQEEDKVRDIEEQMQECKLHAPQDGMVVYYIPENSRWSQTERGLIQQGASVQEGQKMMRIPDLARMQVTTRVHEAMVSRVRGDDRRSTGLHETVKATLCLNASPLNGLLSLQEEPLERQKEAYAAHEYYDAARGMAATIRVDAFPEKALKGHVRTVATVASSSDFFTSDVKVYSTVVSIDDEVPGLRPGMSAEVTIHVDNTLENVLAVPVQAVIGGAESGRTRKVFVMTADGPQEKEIQIGLSNEKMAEVKSGLQAGDQVVVNPKAILGNAAKTREDMPEQGTKGFGKGKGKGKDGGGPPPGGGAGKAPAAKP